jgi:type I restriction enzyme M protein
MMNLVLHGIRGARLKRANVLGDERLTEDDLQRQGQRRTRLAGQIPKESVRADLPTLPRRASCSFLALMMRALAPAALCGGAEARSLDRRARTRPAREGCASSRPGVVSLPAGVFKPYAGVKTSVLVFRRPANAPEEGRHATRRVWFYEVQNDGFDPDKIQGGGRPETPEKSDIRALMTAWAEYKASRFEKPPGVEAGAVLDPGSEQPRCWWAPFETVAENEFNLAACAKAAVGEGVRRRPGEADSRRAPMEREITTGSAVPRGDRSVKPKLAREGGGPAARPWSRRGAAGTLPGWSATSPGCSSRRAAPRPAPSTPS